MIVSFCRMYDTTFNEALQALGVIKPEQYVELWKSDEIIGTRKYQRWWCCYGHCRFDHFGRITSPDVDFLPLMLRAIHLDTRPNTIVFNRTIEYILGEHYNKEAFDSANSVNGLINYVQDLTEHAEHTLKSSDPFNSMHPTTAGKIIGQLSTSKPILEWIARFDLSTIGSNPIDDLMRTIDACDIDDINFRSQKIIQVIQRYIAYRSDEELWKYCYSVGMPLCAPDDGLSLAYMTSKSGILSTKILNTYIAPSGMIVWDDEPPELPKESTDWITFIPKCMRKESCKYPVSDLIITIIINIIESVMNMADGYWNLTICNDNSTVITMPAEAKTLISMVHNWVDATLLISVPALFNQLTLSDKYKSVVSVNFEFVGIGICIVSFLNEDKDSVLRMTVPCPLVIINKVVEYC